MVTLSVVSLAWVDKGPTTPIIAGLNTKDLLLFIQTFDH